MPAPAKPWIDRLFASIDAKDAAGFADHLDDNVTFHFGNQPVVVGSTNVATVVDGFFRSIQGLNHTILEQWQCDDTLICRGQVSYIRHDGSELTVPFANIMKLRDGKACEYRIFSDSSALYTACE